MPNTAGSHIIRQFNRVETDAVHLTWHFCLLFLQSTSVLELTNI